MSIISMLHQIENKEIVLPAIQRDFLWKPTRISTLLDSIMRGYPIGIVLLWETYNQLQYRCFVKDYFSDMIYVFEENKRKQRLKVVLDGQQRLQSLYVSLRGKLDGKSLHFDVLSGREGDDFSQTKYYFEFATPKEAEQWNNETKDQLHKNEGVVPDEFIPRFYVNVQDLFSMGVKERQKFRREVAKEIGIIQDDDLRIESNLARFDEVMTKDETILKASVIDENKPSDSPERQSEADVLEIFVRINTQGISLGRSDLIFSMLKLNWKESAEALPEFVRSLNEGNLFYFDTDFVIRSLFAVSDLGTRFDLELLRKKSNVELLQKNFDTCCKAIQSTVDFVIRECWCQSARVVGGVATMIPLVYYLFHVPKHEVPNKEISNVRKAILIFAFSQPFSRYADSRLGKFIRKELKDRLNAGDYTFPLDRAIARMKEWEAIGEFSGKLVQGNPLLALHLVQQYTGGKVHFTNNEPQIDHIFPQSTLREKEFEEYEIQHFANLWILGKGKNQNKSAKHPKEYFKDVDAGELAKALIPNDMFDYRKFRSFIEHREKAILAAISKKIGLTQNDFDIVLKKNI